ncbi:hypothetical protein PB2503_00480 [Parvularcula bermudensis HTCC2503]|uniref:Uncharacterized protein n=1 Tax=Parvularcula bermudensis (strain ATCC BAA-594 / HTCC2503 / KCTC 12087) TaxID=314260 RepID=E0TIK5_PARBH|nr:TolC family protein [Parvularcula bermudensis]ADM10863.1 hypothetical protein PB2503_00480 [Parvularcula bermudensis HTCC2503]
MVQFARSFRGAALAAATISLLGCAHQQGEKGESAFGITAASHEEAPLSDRPLTSDRAVAVALRDHPALRIAAAGERLAAADLLGAQTLPNPTLTLLDPVGAGVVEGSIVVPFDFLTRGPKIAAARARLEAAELDTLHASITLIRDVRHAFTVAQAAERRAVLLAADADALGQLANIARNSADVGRGTGLNAVAARSTALAASAAAERARADAEIAKAALEAYLGMPLGDATLSEEMAPPNSQLPSLSGLIDAALSARPDVLAAQRRRQAALRDGHGRVVDALAPSGYVDLAKQPSEPLQFSGGGGLAIPIFDRGQAARRRAAARVEESEARLEALSRTAREEVTSARLAYQNALQQDADYANDILPSAEHRLTLTQKSFELGRATLTDVLIARRDLVAIQQAKADTAAAAAMAWADLQYAMGAGPALLPTPGKGER